MRTKLLTALMLAGAVVGCAGNPPPPPPMAEAPPPPPEPAPLGDVSGVYKGTADLAADAPSRCHRLRNTQTVRVRNNSFQLAGLRPSIGPDGAITATGRRGASLSGMANGSMLDMTLTQGQCSYHYMLSKS